jgi:hypothetical protein
MERPAGVAERVAQFGRVGAWGKQVLGNTASKKMVIIMLFFPSLARGPGVLTRRNERTSAVETRGCGMEPAKFGRDLMLTTALIMLILNKTWRTKMKSL